MRIINTLFAWAALLLCSTSLFAHDFEVEGIYYNIASSEEKTVGVTYKGNDYVFMKPKTTMNNEKYSQIKH